MHTLPIIISLFISCVEVAASFVVLFHNLNSIYCLSDEVATKGLVPFPYAW